MYSAVNLDSESWRVLTHVFTDVVSDADVDRRWTSRPRGRLPVVLISFRTWRINDIVANTAATGAATVWTSHNQQTNIIPSFRIKNISSRSCRLVKATVYLIFLSVGRSVVARKTGADLRKILRCVNNLPRVAESLSILYKFFFFKLARLKLYREHVSLLSPGQLHLKCLRFHASFYPRDAMHSAVFARATCPSVWLSVTAGIVSKRKQLASWFLHHLIAHWHRSLTSYDSSKKFSRGHP